MSPSFLSSEGRADLISLKQEPNNSASTAPRDEDGDGDVRITTSDDNSASDSDSSGSSDDVGDDDELMASEHLEEGSP